MDTYFKTMLRVCIIIWKYVQRNNVAINVDRVNLRCTIPLGLLHKINAIFYWQMTVDNFPSWCACFLFVCKSDFYEDLKNNECIVTLIKSFDEKIVSAILTLFLLMSSRPLHWFVTNVSFRSEDETFRNRIYFCHVSCFTNRKTV